MEGNNVNRVGGVWTKKAPDDAGAWVGTIGRVSGFRFPLVDQAIEARRLREITPAGQCVAQARVLAGDRQAYVPPGAENAQRDLVVRWRETPGLRG